MKKQIMIWIFILFTVLIFGNDNENIIMVYKNSAFIQEFKEIDAVKGHNKIELPGMPESMQQDSFFVDFDKKDMISGISYKFNESLPENIMKGKYARVFLDGKMIEGSILQDASPLVIQGEDKKVYSINRDKISYIETNAYNEIPENGTALVEFDAKDSMKDIMKLNYFLDTITWDVKYNFICNDDGNRAKMECRANISNNSGREFKNTKLYIVSGEMNKIGAILFKAMAKSSFVMAPHSEVNRSVLSEYYEYEIKGRFDLDKKENRLVRLVDDSNVIINKEYIYDTDRDVNSVSSVIKTENTEKNGLGIPLPAGVARLYVEKEGQLHFIGEDNIKDTPKGDKIEIVSGNVFDIKVDRKQLGSDKINDNILEERYRIEFKNFRESGVKIMCRERFNSGYWEIRGADFDYRKTDNRTIEFEIEVKPNDTKTAEYTVRKKL